MPPSLFRTDSHRWSVMPLRSRCPPPLPPQASPLYPMGSPYVTHPFPGRPQYPHLAHEAQELFQATNGPDRGPTPGLPGGGCFTVAKMPPSLPPPSLPHALPGQPSDALSTPDPPWPLPHTQRWGPGPPRGTRFWTGRGTAPARSSRPSAWRPGALVGGEAWGGGTIWFPCESTSEPLYFDFHARKLRAYRSGGHNLGSKFVQPPA